MSEYQKKTGEVLVMLNALPYYFLVLCAKITSNLCVQDQVI